MGTDIQTLKLKAARGEKLEGFISSLKGNIANNEVLKCAACFLSDPKKKEIVYFCCIYLWHSTEKGSGVSLVITDYPKPPY